MTVDPTLVSLATAFSLFFFMLCVVVDMSCMLLICILSFGC